jgi:acyl-coenzyme A synthetase/AMP-(fatty) acid ligase
MAPTEYRVIAKRLPLKPLPRLRELVAAGEALNPEVIAVFREALGLGISDGYGQTETGHVSGNLVGDEVRDGSMGRPLPGFAVRIEDGELQVKRESCPTFFSHYLDGEPFDGEWWPTGDVVSQDDDGYLWYEGRRDDVIVSSGYRIGPFEVESALMSHPAVAEAAAVPAPDPERGSVVRAVVVLRDREPGEELAREVAASVADELGKAFRPERVVFVGALPKTRSAKIVRRAVRARALGQDPGDLSSLENPEALEEIARAV